MRGELGFDIESVTFSRDMNAPHGDISSGMIDMTFHIKDDGWLHICGENDWAYLLSDALLPFLNYAQQVFTKIDERLGDYDGTPEVIVLGKNEFRAVDVLHRIRGMGDPIEVYKGITVIQADNFNKIELLGKQDYNELPFA